MPAKTPRRLGRPAASSSADTRQRILDAARRTFADLGWEVATNRHVADKAGVTGAALYHYFDSKLDMYIAVYDDAQELVAKEFAAASAMSDTFVGQFEAMLDTAHRMNQQDQSLARFLESARVDIDRHPELQKGLKGRRRVGDEIVAGLVETGRATGELADGTEQQATAVIRAILIGLNDAVSSDLTVHRAAIDGIRALLEGRFIKPVRKAGNGRGRAATKK